MPPTGPRYSRTETLAKIRQATDIGIKDSEIMGRLQLQERHFYFCKRGDRGLSPRKLSTLDQMISERTGLPTAPTPQGSFDFDAAFESTTPVETPGSPFNLRVLKKRDERVWMVEIRPKAAPGSSAYLVDPNSETLTLALNSDD